MTLRNPRGFALAAALWILVAISALGVGFLTAARAERLAVANARAATRARWAARAGQARILSEIDRTLRGGHGAHFRAASDTILPPLGFGLSETAVHAYARDVRARLQLNLADGEQLERLFRGLGLEGGWARRLADAIIDWRDPDPLRRPGGAEAAEYSRLRPPSHPKNAPFEEVDELLHVFGVTPEAYAVVESFLTAAGDGRINVNAASVPVLLTLPGIDPAGAQAIVTRRRARPFQNPYELLASLPRANQEWIQLEMADFVERIAFAPRQVEIVASATVDGSPVRIENRAQVTLAGSNWKLERVVER